MSATGGESRFQRLKLLGRGGTAEVSAVFDAERKLHAALKAPLPGSTDSERVFTHLVEREVRLIGRERFPGIVKLLDHSTDSPAYLLIELCDGPTVDRIGQIDNWSILMSVLSSLALDLAFLKARGIIHGDIKPHNFFLPAGWRNCSEQQLFYSKLSDFSLGRLESEPESARAGAGTVGYMAPETIRDGRTSHQSDLFALGVIAYQLASGRHPFMHDDCEPGRVNARVTEEEPQSLKTLRPDIPAGLEELIGSLMAKNESDRPRSAFEVCRTLEQLGAEYPYRRAFRPTHLLAGIQSYDEARAATVSHELSKSSYLATRTNLKTDDLRLFLAANWRQGTIGIDGERFGATGHLFWPARMRNHVLAEFCRLSFSRKRQAIIDAVIYDRDIAEDIAVPSATVVGQSSAARSELLLQMLRPRTVKRVAARQAPREERTGNPASASHLYLMAGDISNAERCALDAASTLKQNHAPTAARRTLRRVISFAEIRGDLFEIRQAMMLFGDILKEVGEADKALNVYRQIISLYHGKASDTILAETYKDLGDLYKMKQEFRSGIEALEQALAIYRELHDDVEISHTLNNLGNIHWVNSDLIAALTHYRAALRTQRRHDLKPEIASTINNMASIYALRSRFRRAIRLLKLALGINKELGLAGEVARTLNNMGYAYAVSGQPAAAVDVLRESLIVNRRIGSRKEQLFNLENLSEITLGLGRVTESIHFLDEGSELASELNDKPHQATFHLTSANAYLRLGRIAKAQKALGSARSFLDQIDNRPMEIAHLVLCARIRQFIGDNQLALELAAQAVQAARGLGDHISSLPALLTAVRLSDDSALSADAENIIRKNNLEREHLLIHLERIERLIETGDTHGALALYADVERDIDALDEDIEMPRACVLAAELLLERGDPKTAIRLLERGVARARATGLTPELVTGLVVRASLEIKDNAYEMAYATTRQALQIIKQLAENVGNENDRAIFLSRRSVQDLMTEVRRLGAILGQKQRAE